MPAGTLKQLLFEQNPIMSDYTGMRRWLFAASLVAAGLFAGCESVPPGVEPGPHGTIAYDVLIEASPPGARIEANQEPVGNTPVHLKIFGDKDGTFHDFGSYYYVIQAFPPNTNLFVQTKVYRTGHLFSPEDMVPHEIHFDMSQPSPVETPTYSRRGNPYYYGPYYGGPYYGPYWGPGPWIRPGPIPVPVPHPR
jgi:hypothetical protein